MTASTNMPRWLYSRWSVVACALGGIATVLALGLDRPLVEYYDHITAQFATYGLNFLQVGYLRSGLLNIAAVRPDGSLFLYISRLPLTSILLSLNYRIFGIDEWSTRLLGVITALIALGGYYAALRHSCGAGVATLGAFFFAFSPGNLIFLGHEIFTEALALALAMVYLATYLAWLAKGSKRLLLLVFALVLLGSASSWEFYYYVYSQTLFPDPLCDPPVLEEGLLEIIEGQSIEHFSANGYEVYKLAPSQVPGEVTP